MIILSFALLLFALFIKAEKRCDVLIKQKADLLKALFPFVIILGHVSFKYPDSIIKDMRFAGPYVVGVFFFLSGYGLECKRLGGVARRLKKLFQPLALPLVTYLLLKGGLCDSVLDEVVDSLKSLTLLLPYTWFVTVIALFYVVYCVFRNRFASNREFDAFLIIVTIALFVVLFVLQVDGTMYVSNMSFAMGVMYKQKEQWILSKMKMWGWITCVVVVLVCAFAYVQGTPPFHGFAMLAVPLYVAGFMLLYARVGMCDNRLIRFFKGISYEIYLWQSIPMLVVTSLKINNVWLYVGLVILLSVLMAVVSKRLTNKIFCMLP